MSHNRPFEARVLSSGAHVHIHYWTDDRWSLRNGFGVAEFVCHACGKATKVTYDFPRKDAGVANPELLNLRSRFAHKHRRCSKHQPGLLYTAFCPRYIVTEELDLRRFGRWTPLLRRLRIR